ncbi:hypothetical protein F0562_009391 [Nyssa sinensis]|uniref:Uncharacterized protein n=1 Tax=Nyssa sinensis TaxID=561372 RepID=A0A5J4ZZ36_9ASTE|nr:hypothetical protein F0562_009391 [Nyssa sinensis]
MKEAAAKEENQQVLRVLEALKQASHELQSNPRPNLADANSSAIKVLLELETEADTILSNDPYLLTLSHHLTNLKTIIDTLQRSRGHYDLRSFLIRRVSTQEISRVAGSIESEIQAWIDRESIENLIRTLNRSSPPSSSFNEDTLIDLIDQFVDRIAQGFNRELQDLILKSKVFSELESVLCGSNFSKEVREKAAFAIAELIRFNKDVFVGQVLMGKTIRALISIASLSSFKVLCLLIKSIKSPLVDEIESNGEIPNIIIFLSAEDLSLRIMTMDCVLEIGYFGRKEAIDAMIMADLVKKLVELQRSELGGDLIDMGKSDDETEKRGVSAGGVGTEGKGTGESKERRFLQSHPFASCVARFAVQLEVGEGLRQSEKRAFKMEILKRVREASVSDAEAATIFAEEYYSY